MRLEVIPFAFGAIVDGALVRYDRIFDFGRMGSVDQSFGGREAQPDLRMLLVWPDEARAAEIDEGLARNEVLAMAFQRLRPMVAEPSRIGLYEIGLVARATDNLAIGDADAPGEFAASEHVPGQLDELIAFREREDFEERGYGTYPAMLLEVHLLRHMAAGDLARRLIDDERLGRHDGPVAQGPLFVCRDGVIVERV